jgi:hypothetical protein
MAGGAGSPDGGVGGSAGSGAGGTSTAGVAAVGVVPLGEVIPNSSNMSGTGTCGDASGLPPTGSVAGFSLGSAIVFFLLFWCRLFELTHYEFFELHYKAVLHSLPTKKLGFLYRLGSLKIIPVHDTTHLDSVPELFPLMRGEEFTPSLFATSFTYIELELAIYYFHPRAPIGTIFPASALFITF